MAISDYSTTPASNNTIASIDVSGTTGKVKDGDNVMRAMAADMKAGLITGYTTTATAAGTTTLTVASNSYQYFTGSTTQTIVMPVTSTLELGRTWVIVNNSTGALTVNSSGGNLIVTVPPGGGMAVQCILLTGTTAASWSLPALGGSGLAIYSASAGTIATFTSTEAGAGSGPDIEQFRDSSTPATSDVVGRRLINGRDSAGNKQEYASDRVTIVDATSGSEDAIWTDFVTVGGAGTAIIHRGANAAGTATPNAVGFPLGQLSFPASQNASSDANTLDDYEEGTGTPSVGGTATYTSRSLSYTKIGDTVTMNLAMIINSIGTGSTGSISGQPFTSAATHQWALAVAQYVSLAISVDSLTARVTSGGTSVSLIYGPVGGAVSSNFGGGLLGNSTEIILGGHYKV
jgi:hypothetical protein